MHATYHPTSTQARATACLGYVEQLVIEMKYRLKDPYIIVSGDFNQRQLEVTLEENRDLKDTRAGPTRGDQFIDRTFSNMYNITDKGVLNPLQTDNKGPNVRESNHNFFYMTASLRRKEKYKWLTYSYCHNNPESAKKFREWITCKDWTHLAQLSTSDEMVDLYQKEISWAHGQKIKNPLGTIKRCNIDPSQINIRIKEMVKRRKKVFKESGGHTQEWKKMKKKIQPSIEKRCRIYQE